MIRIPPPDSPLRDQAPGAIVRPAVKTSLALMLLLTVGAALWGWFGRLDVVSTSMGEVVPSTQVKKVQHLEGGIVRALLVKEGDLVEAGQPILELEAARNDADVQELQVRIAALRARVARLEAENTNAGEVIFTEAFVKLHPELVRRARGTFLSRRRRLMNQVAAQKETIVQRTEEENQIRARIKNTRKQLSMVKEQLKIAKDLLRDELISRIKFLDIKRQASVMEGQIGEDTSALKRLSASIREARFQLQAIRDDFAETVHDELAKKSQSLAEYTQRMTKYRDSQRRTVIRSPADGIIKTLYVVTVGGVILPGGSVADIVPVSEQLVIEARLPVQEVGYVSPGQNVNIRLASKASSRFNAISGTVESISPDAIESQRMGAYYRVRITTRQGAFQNAGVIYKLIPGVQVICNIITGQRSVLAYVLGPILTGIEKALRER